MRRFKLSFVFVFIVLVFSGCIEIVEDITVHKDKSGSVKLGVYAEGMGMLLGLFSSGIDEELIDEILEAPSQAATRLNSMKGISNIAFGSDKRKGEMHLSFDFDNSKNLNKALYKIFDYKKDFFEPSLIRVSNKRFKKRNFAPMFRLAVNTIQPKLKKIPLTQMVTYKTKWQFPDEIIYSSNKKFMVNGNTATLSSSLGEILNSKVNVGNTVKW